MLVLFYAGVRRSYYLYFAIRQNNLIVRSFYICLEDFCGSSEDERYIFVRFDSIRGNRGDGLIENKTEEGTRGSLTSRAS